MSLLGILYIPNKQFNWYEIISILSSSGTGPKDGEKRKTQTHQHKNTISKLIC